MWKRGLRNVKNERIRSKTLWAISALTVTLFARKILPLKQNSSYSKVTESSSLRLFRTVEKTRAEKVLTQKGRQQFEYFRAGTEFHHELMLSCLDAFLSHKPRAKWLTLGDVWAREAIYISKNQGHATASSLQDHAIREAKRLGFIDDFSVQNAESITFKDKSFDFVFMKEAFHHLARPYTAIYEMVRVAKDAAILFEPTDSTLTTNLSSVNASIFYSTFRTDFEPCGFQFRLNTFEMVKTAMALNLPAIGFRGWNDPYKSPLESTSESQYRKDLEYLNGMGKKGDRMYNLMAVAFILRDDETLLDRLQAFDFEVMRLEQFDDFSRCI